MPGKSPILRKSRPKSARDDDPPDPQEENPSFSPGRENYQRDDLCPNCQLNCSGSGKFEDIFREIYHSVPPELSPSNQKFKNVFGDDFSAMAMKADPTLIINAIQNRQTPIVNMLVEQNFAISGRSPITGSTPLIEAVVSQEESIVEILLAKGADPNESDVNSCSALMYSTDSDNTAISKMLVKYGAKLIIPPRFDKTRNNCSKNFAPSHGPNCPCNYSNCRLFDGIPHPPLDSQDAPIGLADIYDNPLITAVRNKNYDLFSLLMQMENCGQNSPKNGYNLLIEAIKHRHDPILNTILAQPDLLHSINNVCGHNQKTALSMASKRNHIDIADRLLSLGADIEGGAPTPLMEACKMGHSEMVDFLLEKGADPFKVTSNNKSTMLFAAMCDCPYIVVKLFKEMIAQRDDKFVRSFCNQADNFGKTPLMMACNNGNYLVASFFLDESNSIEFLNTSMADTGHTPFTLACGSGCAELVSLLYQKGADPLHQLNDGSTVLHKVANSNNPGLVSILHQFINEVQAQGDNYDELRKSPVSSTTEDSDENTPFNLRKSHKVLSTNICSIVNYINPPTDQAEMDFQFEPLPDFSEHYSDEHFCLTSPFADFSDDILENYKFQPPAEIYDTIQPEKDVKIFDSYLRQKDSNGYTPLMAATASNDLEMVKELISHGANVLETSNRKDSPLGIAASAGHSEIVKYFIEKGANMNQRNISDYTPLGLASSAGHLSTMEILLSAGADVNSSVHSKYGITPCMLASLNGHCDALELLIQHRCDINRIIETNRNSALTLACYHNHPRVVEVLLRHGAYIEHRSKNGYTPLMEAAAYGYDQVGSVLIRMGADVNAAPTSQTRDNALLLAAENGKTSFVEMLLRSNVQLEVKNKKGCTALWLAASAGHIFVVRLLLTANADVYACGLRGMSCLEIAFRHGHVEVVRMLVEMVKEYPSDGDCQKFISTIMDCELLDRCKMCLQIMTKSKRTQILEADRNADMLLRQIEDEKMLTERKKEASIRRRENKKRKKNDKQQVEDSVGDSKSDCPQTDCPAVERADDLNGETNSVSSEIEPSKDDDSNVDFLLSDDEVNTTPANCYNYKLPEITDFYPPAEATNTADVPQKTENNYSENSVFPSKRREKVKRMNIVCGEELTQEISRKSRVILVYSSLFGRIMGRGGAHMNKIREISLATIEVEQQQPGLEQRRIKIRGNAKSMKVAHQIISHIVTDQSREVVDILAFYEEEAHKCEVVPKKVEETKPLQNGNQVNDRIDLLLSRPYSQYGFIRPIEPHSLHSCHNVTPPLMQVSASSLPQLGRTHRNGLDTSTPRPNSKYHYESQYLYQTDAPMPPHVNGGTYISSDYLPPAHFSQDYFNYPGMIANGDIFDPMYSDYFMANPDMWMNGYREVEAFPKNRYYSAGNGRPYYDPVGFHSFYDADQSRYMNGHQESWRNDRRNH